jgi:hypothetical protein
MSGILEYSTTPGSNTAINSIGIEGSDAVNNFDNALRQLLADVASQITRRVTKSTAYTVLKTDHKSLIECTAALTLSMTAAATLTNGFMCIVKANGGAVTIDPASSEQIDGATTVVIADGDAAFVYCNGSAFFTITVPSAIAALTPTDGNFIVGDGTTWVAESGATAIASLGILGIANTWTENQKLNDSVTVTFGSDDDTTLSHDGTDFTLSNNTGDVYVDNLKTSGVGYLRCNDSGDVIRNCITYGGSAGAATLYYSGTSKLQTTSAGITINGTLTVTG